jgi:hypothetical protein
MAFPYLAPLPISRESGALWITLPSGRAISPVQPAYILIEHQEIVKVYQERINIPSRHIEAGLR